MRLATLALALILVPAAHAQSFSPADGPYTRDHVLVGSTPDGRIFARVGARLGVTTDGVTWTVVSETAAPRRIAGDGTAIYGAFLDGVRVSNDGGATWTPFGLDGLSVLDLAVSETVYALTATAVYRLGDAAVWQQTTRPGAAQGAQLSRLDAAGGTVAVAALEQSCSGNFRQGATYRSRDAGATWTRTRITGLPADIAVASDGTAYTATTDGELCPTLAIVTLGALFEQGPTQDAATLRASGERGGVAINAAGQPVTMPYGMDPAAQSGEIVVTGEAIVVSTRPLTGACFDPPCPFVSPSGLYAVRGGAAVPTGFVRSAVRAMTREGATPVVPSDGAVYRLVEDRLIFAVSLGDVRAFVTTPSAPSSVIAFSGGAGAPTPELSPYNFPLIATLGGTSTYPSLYTTATASATVSGDRILTASAVTYGLPGILVTPAGDGSTVTLQHASLGTVAAVDGPSVYAGAVDGVTFGDDPPARIFRSDDAGDTWTLDDAGMTARNVYAFTAVGAGDARLDLAGTSGGVFSRISGAPWQPAGIEARTVRTFAQTPAGLVAGTDDGLFLRASDGSWTRYGTGLDGRTVYAVLATEDQNGEWIGVGTDAGLYQTRAFGVASESAPDVRASVLSIEALPNPSAGRTTLRVTGASAEARIEVFDLLGRRVADLGTEARTDVVWDASNLPSGLYVVRVRSGAEVATVRAVIRR